MCKNNIIIINYELPTEYSETEIGIYFKKKRVDQITDQPYIY